MTLLVVDDDDKTRAVIMRYAAFDGYSVDEAPDGMAALDKFRKNRYDLIIMDVMMPELDGFSAIREIRKTSRVPVIILSARGEEYDRIHGFELGIDDYVVKPFFPRELIMRVTAVLRRCNTTPGGDPDEPFVAGDLKIDFVARRVTVRDRVLKLSPKEYELLFYLVRNRGIALPREKLISDVWGYDFFGDDRTLDTHIKLLRKELGSCAGRIVTLRGVGYRFDNEA